jgi:hypothetical protein
VNPQEQLAHASRTAQLAARLDDQATVVEALVIETKDAFESVAKVMGDERGLRMRDVAELKACCQERWDSTTRAQKLGFDYHYAFVSMSFWARVKWLMGIR